MNELVLSVPDISCGHCKAAIEGAVSSVSGVHSVEVDVGDRTVDVVFDDAATDRGVIVAAIEGQGYEVAG